MAIALLLSWLPTCFAILPQTALAAVVIASAIGLIEVSDLRRIYRIQMGVLAVEDLFAGRGTFARFPACVRDRDCRHRIFVGRVRPHSAVLGRAWPQQGITTSRASKRAYSWARAVSAGIAPLFFANAELFHDARPRRRAASRRHRVAGSRGRRAGDEH
jgi:hypothetical protein